MVHNAAGAVAPFDEHKGHGLKGPDVRPVGKLLPDHFRLVPEELVGEGAGHHHHQPLLGEGDGLHPVQHDGLKADDQVHPAVGQLVLQLVGVALVQGEVHHGELLPEAGQDVGQQGQAAGVGEAHPQHAQIVAVDVPHLAEILAVQVDDLGGRLHQLVPGIGEGQLGGAGEQLHVQLPFHVADVAGQGLLRDVKPLGGPGDVQLLGHHEEVFQM